MNALAIYSPEDLNRNEPPPLSDFGWRFLAEGDSWFTIGSLNPAKNSNLPLALLDELKADAATHRRREEIGLRLAQMGDPRRGVGLDEAGLPLFAWMDIPAGEVNLKIDDWQTRAPAAKGRRKQQRTPRTTFEVKPFKLARYPVT